MSIVLPHRGRRIDRRRMLAGLGAGVLAAWAASAAAKETDMLTITGEITYLQRIALPDSAVAVVELRPADLPDGTPVIAESVSNLDGAQVPVTFALTVERDRLAADEAYVLRAGIRVDGELRWLSRPVPIDVAAGTVDAGTIVVQPFQALSPFGIVGHGELEGADWRVVEIDGAPISTESAFTLGFAAAGSFHGRACNHFRGTYSLDGGAIGFGNAAATMMACPEPLMAQEQALFKALETARQASIGPDDELVLAGADGSVVLRARREAQ